MEAPAKVKFRGITAITLRGVESSVITRPITLGSPANRRFQYPLVRMTVSGAPG
jgi:hypothetical protein